MHQIFVMEALHQAGEVLTPLLPISGRVLCGVTFVLDIFHNNHFPSPWNGPVPKQLRRMATLSTELMKLGRVSPGKFDQNVLILRLGMKQATILVPNLALVCHFQNVELKLPIFRWWPCRYPLDIWEGSVTYSCQGRTI